MKTTKYIGLFKSAEGHEYQLEVNCNGFLQAFFLLTADAIRTGQNYQLYSITDERNGVRKIDDIHLCSKLIN